MRGRRSGWVGEMYRRFTQARACAACECVVRAADGILGNLIRALPLWEEEGERERGGNCSGQTKRNDRKPAGCSGVDVAVGSRASQRTHEMTDCAPSQSHTAPPHPVSLCPDMSAVRPGSAWFFTNDVQSIGFQHSWTPIRIYRDFSRPSIFSHV